MTGFNPSQRWTSLPSSALDALWQNVYTNKTAAANVKAVVVPAASADSGSLDDLWAGAYASKKVLTKVVANATAGTLDDLWASVSAGKKHVNSKVVTEASSATVSESIRQGRATLYYAKVYQWIILGFIALLTLRNVAMYLEKRYRKYELNLEATAQEKIDRRRSMWSMRTGRPDLADQEIKVSARMGTIEQMVYFPLNGKWYWFGMDNTLQVFIFVVAFALNSAFILAVDTDFRGPQNSTWNIIHVVALRCGFMSMAQLPAVFALTGRNNLVTLLTGIEYQHTRFAHKLLACWFGLLGLIHTVDASVAAAVWMGGDSVKQLYLHNYLGQTGLVMLAGTLVLGVLSLRRIRARWYELFLFTHVLGALMITAALIAHVPDLRIWVIVPLAFWMLERLMRWVQLISVRSLTRLQWRAPYVKAHAQLVEGAVVLRVPYKGTWGPGSHAYISIVDPRFYRTPWIWTQNHPFSIANVSSQSQADLAVDPSGATYEMIFVMRTRDGMTKILADHLMASCTGSFPIWVGVEGPYGGMSDLEHYNSVLLVGGGAGITHLQSILGDSIHKASSGYSRAKSIRLVWTIQTIEQSIWTLTELLKLTQKAAAVGVDVFLEVYVTRGVFSSSAPVTPVNHVSLSRNNSVDSELTKIGLDPEKELGLGIGMLPKSPRSPAQQEMADFDDALEESGMEGQVQIIGGRPRIDELVPEFVMNAKGRRLVTVCGPAQLAGGVRRAVLPLVSQFAVDMDIALFEC